MRIDIDTLTEAELIDLNNRVVARLRFLVTVVTDDGQRWNVAPSILRRLDPTASTDASVIPLRKA